MPPIKNVSFAPVLCFNSADQDPVPPIVHPDTWRLFEPDGLTTITDNKFFALEEDDWQLFESEEEIHGHAELVTTDSPFSVSGNAIRMVYEAGFGDGEAPASLGYYEFETQLLYFCFPWKCSDNFQNQVGGTNKIAFVVAYGYAGGGDPAFICFQTDGSGAGEIVIRQQGPGVDTKPEGKLTPNLATVMVEHGQEVMIQGILKMNTPGLKDGWGKLYIDEVQTTDYTDVEWCNAGYIFNAFKNEPTWGGSDEDVVENEMYQEIPRIYLSAA